MPEYLAVQLPLREDKMNEKLMKYSVNNFPEQ